MDYNLIGSSTFIYGFSSALRPLILSWEAVESYSTPSIEIHTFILTRLEPVLPVAVSTWTRLIM